MTDFEKYVDQVTDELYWLGQEYCNEAGVDYSEIREGMYNARSTMAVMYKQEITPRKCAGMIFSLHCHPVMF